MTTDLFTADAVPTDGVITCCGCGAVLPDERAMLTHLCPAGVLITEVSVLDVKPGQVLVLKVKGPVSQDQRANIDRHLAGILPPGTPTLILDPQMDLLVVDATEAAA